MTASEIKKALKEYADYHKKEYEKAHAEHGYNLKAEFHHVSYMAIESALFDIENREAREKQLGR